MTVCPSCGCHQPDGLLCSQDTTAVETMFAAVPGLVDQLQVSITKQARGLSNGTGKGLARELSPVHWGAVAARDALVLEHRTWADHIDALRIHPDAGTIVARIGRTVRDAYREIDRMQDRKFLGECGYTEADATCHAELWARAGANQVTCSQCETVYDVAERRATLLIQAEDLIVTPREAAQYIGELGGITIGHQRIRNYLDRGRIAERPSPDRYKRFRFGDLLDVIRADTRQQATV